MSQKRNFSQNPPKFGQVSPKLRTTVSIPSNPSEETNGDEFEYPKRHHTNLGELGSGRYPGVGDWMDTEKVQREPVFGEQSAGEDQKSESVLGAELTIVSTPDVTEPGQE